MPRCPIRLAVRQTHRSRASVRSNSALVECDQVVPVVASLDSDIKEKMALIKKAMAEGATGRTLKRELSKELRGLMNPLVAEQRRKVLSLPSKGGHTQSMRQAIARQTKAQTRWSGRNMGVNIVQRARSMPRGFNMAGRMFNRDEGWNPTTLGGETVHQQIRPSGWFDDVTAGQRPEVGRKVHAALEATADRIASSVRSV